VFRAARLGARKAQRGSHTRSERRRECRRPSLLARLLLSAPPRWSCGQGRKQTVSGLDNRVPGTQREKTGWFFPGSWVPFHLALSSKTLGCRGGLSSPDCKAGSAFSQAVNLIFRGMPRKSMLPNAACRGRDGRAGSDGCLGVNRTGALADNARPVSSAKTTKRTPCERDIAPKSPRLPGQNPRKCFGARGL
jgi:hypothetical protein